MKRCSWASFTFQCSVLDDLRSQGHDLHKIAFTQFAGNRPEDACADRRTVILDQNGRIIVKTDVCPVLSAYFFMGANDDGVIDLSFLGGPVRGRFFYRNLYRVAKACDL